MVRVHGRGLGGRRGLRAVRPAGAPSMRTCAQHHRRSMCVCVLSRWSESCARASSAPCVACRPRRAWLPS
eukprot:5141107-Alexandrium_andersonii.AAC.1